MPNNTSRLSVDLLYSYSHEDAEHKEAMDKMLATLKEQGFLKTWSDSEILPGRPITAEIEARLPHFNIYVFLFSPDFLASPECRYEWEKAKQFDGGDRPVFRVPIIVRDCPWKQFIGDDNVKELPADGKPVVTYRHRDSAWKAVYDGIRSVTDYLHGTDTGG